MSILIDYPNRLGYSLFMTNTAATETVTNEQISQLRAEAAVAGDIAQVALCDVAIDGVVAIDVDLSANLLDALNRRFADLAISDAKADARAECARVICSDRA